MRGCPWCCYRATPPQGLEALGEERVSTAAAVMIGRRADGERWVGAGTGIGAYPQIASRLGIEAAWVLPQLLPRAQEIARIAQREVAAGRTLDAAAALPVYLRDKVVGTRP
jgi:tRNA A37 threonylcarbamoyladenosine modification protein TsaB